MLLGSATTSQAEETKDEPAAPRVVAAGTDDEKAAGKEKAADEAPPEKADDKPTDRSPPAGAAADQPAGPSQPACAYDALKQCLAGRAFPLCAWLTYRPLVRPNCACCCCKCGNCHTPRLYTYFLDRCAGGGGGCGPHAGPGAGQIGCGCSR